MDLKQKFSASKDVWFAIDYGTSNSLMAATDGHSVTEPLPLDLDAVDPTIFRSVLYFPNQDRCFYGTKAISEYCEQQSEGRLIRSIKKYLPSETFIGSWIDNRLVRLEDLIGYFLLEMRKRGSQCIGRDVTSVMLGRPARFSQDSAQDRIAEYRLRKAAEYAGFTRIEFLPEPLAAAFDLRRSFREQKKVLVVDLGGGTSDFTVLEIGPRPFKEADVLALAGVSIAGDVMDGRIMQFEIAPSFGSEVRYRVPLSKNILQMPKSLLDHICSPADIAQIRKGEFYQFFEQMRRWTLTGDDDRRLNRLSVLINDQLGFQLFEHIENCKRDFSRVTTSRFHFDYPEIELDFVIPEQRFIAAIQPDVDRILQALDETLKLAQLAPAGIDLVYATGGTSKLRQIQSGLEERFTLSKITKNRFFHSVIEGLVERTRELIR